MDGLRQRLIPHACILELIRPFATGASVAVLQVLTEVVGAVELLVHIALAEFVDDVEVLDAFIPVRRIVELVSAIAAGVCGSWRWILPVGSDGHHGGRWGGVEDHVEAGQGSAGPRVSTKMQRVLMALHLVLVLETVRAVHALVLFLGFMRPVRK